MANGFLESIGTAEYLPIRYQEGYNAGYTAGRNSMSGEYNRGYNDGYSDGAGSYTPSIYEYSGTMTWLGLQSFSVSAHKVSVIYFFQYTGSAPITIWGGPFAVRSGYSTSGTITARSATSEASASVTIRDLGSTIKVSCTDTTGHFAMIGGSYILIK